MLSDSDVDFFAPFNGDKLLEVRYGGMKPMEGLRVLSGIDKTPCGESVWVTRDGIRGDEHDRTFHGGPDKAIHGYCSSHYPAWRKEFPEAASRFRPGAFGENFVTAVMNERNVCIGDVVAVGDQVVLQVSLPRQPCFKLNHRFRIKNFAPLTWKSSRTGWYYRVLKEGSVVSGDAIRLVERPHPRWTIERVQEHLHRNKDVLSANEELAAIGELGDECRNNFKARVAKARAKEEKAKRGAASGAPIWKPYKVAQKTHQTPRIASFVLEAAEPPLPDAGGLGELAHVKIKLGNGLVRAYSVVGGSRQRFEIAVALDENSRGGSRYLHQEVEVGHVVQVGAAAAPPLGTAMTASNHVFVVGGIGITAFLTLAETLVRINYSCAVHYAVRSSDDVPFRERLDKLGDVVVLYDKQKGQRLDVPGLVAGLSWNSHLYVCGPQRLTEEVQQEVRVRGIPDAEVHYEAFEADVTGDPFEFAVANRGGETVRVGEDETLLEVLRRKFDDDMPSSCEVGSCGTCKIKVTQGCVDHRGTALQNDEKASAMLPCISRGRGQIVIEI